MTFVFLVQFAGFSSHRHRSCNFDKHKVARNTLRDTRPLRGPEVGLSSRVVNSALNDEGARLTVGCPIAGGVTFSRNARIQLTAGDQLLAFEECIISMPTRAGHRNGRCTTGYGLSVWICGAAISHRRRMGNHGAFAIKLRTFSRCAQL